MPASPDDPNYVNVVGATAAGLELSAAFMLPRLSLRASYTLLETEVTDEGTEPDPSFLQGQPLLRRPEHSGSLTATALFERGSAGATVFYVGERADLDFASWPAGRVELPAYTRVDLTGELRVTKAAAATLEIENVAAAAYEEVLHFEAPRRVLFLGARLSF
jgi:outer membrane cobalamin receptor